MTTATATATATATDNAHAATCPHCCGTGKVGVSREAIDDAIAAAAFARWAHGGAHAIGDDGVAAIAREHGVGVSFVVARAKAIGLSGL